MTDDISRTSGIYVSWAAVALTAALIVSLVTGAIQLGGVQTQVLVNTRRIDSTERDIRTLISEHANFEARIAERLSRREAASESNEKRITRIEESGPPARVAESSVIERLARIESRLVAIEAGIVKPTPSGK